MVGADPVHTCDHVGCVSIAGAVQDPNTGDARRFGDPVGGTDGGAGHVRPVPITVRRVAVVIHEVVAGNHATRVLGVRRPNAGIDHVHGDPGTRARRGEGAVQWQGALIDAIQAPGGIRLNGVDGGGGWCWCRCRGW